MEISADDTGKTLDLPVGGQIRLQLAENPTTGYQWKLLDSAQAVLRLVSDSFELSGAKGRVGAGGVRTWVFQAQQAGTGEIRMEYARPFGNAPVNRTFQITLRVLPAD